MYLSAFGRGKEHCFATASYIIPKSFNFWAGPWHFDKFGRAVVIWPVAITSVFNLFVWSYVEAPPKMSSIYDSNAKV